MLSARHGEIKMKEQQEMIYIEYLPTMNICHERHIFSLSMIIFTFLITNSNRDIFSATNFFLSSLVNNISLVVVIPLINNRKKTVQTG